ncbi:MAG: ParB/RepB/Spo0J family partition protein [Holosporales bacterium]|jgi:ParB family chromosome partitioning protein|nr:ParB/RepB/Spo0J family partition protein [Holosporales bacterium]
MEKRLGRGLAALLGDAEKLANSREGRVDIEQVVPNNEQPRKSFDDTKIDELAGSISLYGLLQPIVVRRKDNIYEIVAGERRWRAAKRAGLKEIPVHVVDCEPSEINALALIENLQRTDLNPIEEAEAMKNLMINCECRQEDIAVILSKSRSYVGNVMRLLHLPERVRELIRTGKLSVGHAKCLAGLSNAEEVAGLAVEEGWNVRQLEKAMKDIRGGGAPEVESVEAKPVYTSTGTLIDPNQDHEAMDIAIRITEALQIETKLKITRKGGVLTLICKSGEELETLIRKLTTPAAE